MPETETFSVACPRCGATYNVPLELLGKKALCPSCSAKFAMEPPPGPLGRELRAKLAKLKEGQEPPNVMEDPEDGEVVSNLVAAKALLERKAQEPPKMLSTNTVKLARFKKNPLEEKAGMNEAHVAVDSNALQAALKEQHAHSGRRTITSGVKNQDPAEEKKWWKFWK